jgi:lysophospholipase L1-like esterase
METILEDAQTLSFLFHAAEFGHDSVLVTFHIDPDGVLVVDVVPPVPCDGTCADAHASATSAFASGPWLRLTPMTPRPMVAAEFGAPMELAAHGRSCPWLGAPSIADIAWQRVFTWTFGDGRATISVSYADGGSVSCSAQMQPVGDLVRLTYAGDCGGEVDSIRWALEDDGLHLTLVGTNAPFEDNRAYLEAEPWQPVETPAATAAPSPSPAATFSSAADALHMVVIGDSIPFTAFCGACTAGFTDEYAADLEARTGRPVEVINRSRDDSAGMLQIRTQVTDDRTLRDQIAAADVVIVSVGFNNVLPDAASGIGCLGDMGDSVESYTMWLLATTPECRQVARDAYAADYDVIFSTITDLRAGAPTLYAALNVHDGNKGDPALHADTVPKAIQDQAESLLTSLYDDWNAMLCDRASQAGFTCVDVYHAFNGPTGEQPSGDWTVDGAHPSQAGNDLIAKLLGKLYITTIDP